MSEFEPLTLAEIPGVRRLNVNDLLYQTPLDSDTADDLNDAVDEADSLASKIYELLEQVEGLGNKVVENNDMSLAQSKEIEGYLDTLCDKRTAVESKLATVTDAEQRFQMLADESDSGVLSDSAESVLNDVGIAVSAIESLHEAVEYNIESIKRFIDQ